MNLFMEYNLEILRGCDEKYTYEFTRDASNIDEEPEEWMNFENFEYSRIIEMAKKLQLSVVCEGVETKQQVDFLRQVDCDLVQGYYYSRPVPQKVFSQMLEDDDFVLHQEQMEQ